MAGWVWKWLLGVGVAVALTYPISLPVSIHLVEAALVSPVRKIWYQRKFDTMARERGSADAALGEPPFRRRYNHPLSLDELAAVVNFPNATACLDTRGGSARIAWDRFRVRADAEVCMFRVLNRGVPLPRTVAWIESQGLRVSRRDERVSIIRQSSRPPTIYSISARWGPEGPQFLDRRVFSWSNPVWRPYGQSFQIFLNSSGTQIVDVHLNYSYL